MGIIGGITSIFRNTVKRLTVNGFEIYYNLSSKVTCFVIFGYDEIKTPQLLLYLSDYLSRMPMSIPFVDIWADSEPHTCVEQSTQKAQLRKNRHLYILPSPSLMSNAQEEWFDARCTLLGGFPSKQALSAYVSHLHWTPEKALRRGHLSAYLCGDETDGYSFGVRGRDDELMNGLVSLLR